MTTTDHPITPPPELVEQWAKQMLSIDGQGGELAVDLDWFAAQAARWGADQELEACCEWVSQWRCLVGGTRPEVGLRAARRPQPPSLAKRALHILGTHGDLSCAEHDAIRRALEALDD